ncbi:MAG: hypothetical protein R3A43_04305 [Bacteroidia bacterium]
MNRKTILKKEHIKIFSLLSQQGLLQVIDILVAFLLIRYIPKVEYTLYLLAVGVSISMNTLSDMGLGSVMLSEGGKVWQQDDKISELLNSYRILRYRLSLFFFALVGILTWYLFYLNHFSFATFLIAIVLMLSDFWLKMGYHGNRYVLQLKGMSINLQRMETIGSLVKFIFVGVLLLLGIRSGLMLLIPLVIGSLITFELSKKKVDNFLVKSFNHTNEYFKPMKKKILNQIPYNIYSFFSSQINSFILSFFGTALIFADYNVLMKIGIFTNIIISFVSIYVNPIIAKAPKFSEFKKIYFRFLFLSLFLSALFSLSVYIFKETYISIVGFSFQTILPYIKPALLLINLQLLFNYSISVNYASGLNDKFWLLVPITILSQIVSFYIIDVSSIGGVINFNILSILPSIIFSFILSLVDGKKRFDDPQFQIN